jgi:hypothetical protein
MAQRTMEPAVPIKQQAIQILPRTKLPTQLIKALQIVPAPRNTSAVVQRASLFVQHR